MLPHSIRVRAQYLDEHPQVGCVGALIIYMDSEGRTVKEQQRDHNKVHTFDGLLRPGFSDHPADRPPGV